MTSFQRAWRGTRSDWRLHLLSVFSVAVAFVCLASAFIVVFNVDAIRSRWASSGRASVYLKEGVSREQAGSIERALGATPGVSEVRFVSSEQARQEVVDEDDEGVLALLPKGAFPASLEAKLAGEDAVQRLSQLRLQLEALPEVEGVETYQAWTERLKDVLMGVLTAAGLLSLIVFAAVVSVVSSTLRLTLQRRRIEVEVLKLVGATDGYVRQPFVVEGAAQGALGALLATLILGILFLVVRGHFDAQLGVLLGISPQFLPWPSVLALIVLGAGLGAASAHFSLRRLLVAA